MFTRQQAAALSAIKQETEPLGVALAAIGSARPDQARAFVNAFGFAGEMYCDPHLKSFRAFDLERGVMKTLGPASIIRGLSTMKQGFRQGKSAGDLWQQGGVFVIGPGDTIHFAHRDSGAGDHADLSDVVAACRA